MRLLLSLLLLLSIYLTTNVHALSNLRSRLAITKDMQHGGGDGTCCSEITECFLNNQCSTTCCFVYASAFNLMETDSTHLAHNKHNMKQQLSHRKGQKMTQQHKQKWWRLEGDNAADIPVLGTQAPARNGGVGECCVDIPACQFGHRCDRDCCDVFESAFGFIEEKSKIQQQAAQEAKAVAKAIETVIADVKTHDQQQTTTEHESALLQTKSKAAHTIAANKNRVQRTQ